MVPSVPDPRDSHFLTLQALLADLKLHVLEALNKDLCLGEAMQGLLAEVAKAELVRRCYIGSLDLPDV